MNKKITILVGLTNNNFDLEEEIVSHDKNKTC